MGGHPAPTAARALPGGWTRQLPDEVRRPGTAPCGLESLPPRDIPFKPCQEPSRKIRVCTRGCGEPLQSPQPIPRPLRQACWIWPPRLRGRRDFTQLTPPCVEACAFTSWVDPCPGQLRTVGLPGRRPLSLPDLHKAVRQRVTYSLFSVEPASILFRGF